MKRILLLAILLLNFSCQGEEPNNAKSSNEQISSTGLDSESEGYNVRAAYPPPPPPPPPPPCGCTPCPDCPTCPTCPPLSDCDKENCGWWNISCINRKTECYKANTECSKESIKCSEESIKCSKANAACNEALAKCYAACSE